jgi:hypothetical protein
MVSPAGLVYIGAVLDQRFDRNWTSKAHRMMKGSDSVLVGGMDVDPRFQQLKKSPPLFCRPRVALATNLKEFELH